MKWCLYLRRPFAVAKIQLFSQWRNLSCMPFVGCVSESQIFQLEIVLQIGAIASRNKNIISSEIWCHDCHVMCDWDFFVRLSAASFTAAVSCCNASNSDCTAIGVVGAIRTQVMTDHKVAGSTDCRRCHLSWNSSFTKRIAGFCTLWIDAFLNVLYKRYWKMSSNDQLSCKMCVVQGPCWPWSRPSRHAGITKAAKCPTKNAFLKASAQIEQAYSLYCFCPRIKQIFWNSYFMLFQDPNSKREALDSVQLAFSYQKVGTLELGWIVREMLSNWQSSNEPWSWSGRKRLGLPVSKSKNHLQQMSW